jgi:RimJ/RimL family protein N-acetyltransferase
MTKGTGAEQHQIEFRALAEDDLPQVFMWLRKPHVAKWYAAAPDTFAEVAAKYGPRTEAGNAVRAFIVVVDGRDAGYIQAYAIEDFPEYAGDIGAERGVEGIDVFLGEEALLGRGIGSQTIRRFVDEVVFRGDGALACVAGPNEGNQASIRAFEKAGFRQWKVVKPGGGEPERVMRRENRIGDYRIELIHMDHDEELCIAFRREMYAASFGSYEGVEEEMGEDNSLYLEQLRARIEQLPEGNVHLWRGDRIVGQAEMKFLDEEPGIGYVSLFYVAADCRGEGLGRVLHEHAVDVFRRHGRKLMRLSVSISNASAIAFYRKLGWTAVGTRPNKEPMAIMEYSID